MFQIKYALWETFRRPNKTLFVVILVFLLITSWVLINAYVDALVTARENVFKPLKNAYVDFIITSPSNNINNSDNAEHTTRIVQAKNVVPGKKFIEDSFNLNNLSVFTANQLNEISSYSSLKQQVTALLIQMSRLEGRYPETIEIPEETVAPLTDEEKKKIDSELESNSNYKALMSKFIDLQNKVISNSAFYNETSQMQEISKKMKEIEFNYYPQRFKKFEAKEIKPINVKTSQTKLIIAGVDVNNSNFGLISRKEIIQGTYFLDNNEETAILRKDYAEDKHIKVGDILILNQKQFKVAGLAKPVTGLSTAEIYLPLGTLQQLINNKVVNVVLVKLKGVEKAKSFKEFVLKFIPKSQVIEPLELSSQISTTLGKSEMLVKGYASFLVLVITVSSVIIMSIGFLLTLISRKKELGILKVVGWSNFKILQQVSIELLIQTFFGIIISLLLNWALFFILNRLDFRFSLEVNSIENDMFGTKYTTFELFHPLLDLSVFSQAALVSLLVAMLVGFFTVTIFNSKTSLKSLE